MDGCVWGGGGLKRGSGGTPSLSLGASTLPAGPLRFRVPIDLPFQISELFSWMAV